MAIAPETLQKEETLKEILRGYGSIAIAYSGGVDSTYLADVAAETLGDAAHLVIADSPSLPRGELGAAKLRAFQERHLGRTVEVLFEGGTGMTWRGHLGNYLEVAVRSPQDMTNRLCRVVLDGIDGELMTGKLL